MLLAAQFLSALADNALLIVTIAVLQQNGEPGWMAPALKFCFTVSYVVLAPFVGPLADAFPKARLMSWMIGVKIAGVTALLFGLQPLLAFAVVGLGAAAYAPAKYGLVTELVAPHRLVAANAWLEVSVIAAVLSGTVLGGILVSPWLLGWPGIAWARGACSHWLPDPGILGISLAVLLMVYALAGTLNLLVPDSGARYAPSRIHPKPLVREFRTANLALWRDRDGGLSLAATTILWGAGATLQFAVLRWSAEVLKLSLDQSAYLQAATAVGVVIGAAAAARWVSLDRAKSMLSLGIVFGLLLPVVASAHQLMPAIALLVVVGLVGGLLVVPLNALLQHRGCVLLSAGRSIAVQGFNENASVLIMLAVYAGLLAADLPIVAVMWAFGMAIALATGLVVLRDRFRNRGPVESSAAA